MPGSSWTRSSRHAGRHGRRQALLEEGLDLGDHVVVARIGLHGARLAQHVHQAAVQPAVGDQSGQLGVVPERGDVVDVGRPRVDRRLGHRELHRVDRDARGEPEAGDALDHREHAPQLLVHRHRVGARPRRLAADVDDGRTLLHQPRARAATAASASGSAPPSENESGVTLTTPMIS